MAEAARLASPTGLRALTYTTLIGLLTSTGLRPGEALALGRSDVDLENGILAIRQTKFGKSRFVPVSDSTRAALQEYAKQRDTLQSEPPDGRFLFPSVALGCRGVLPAALSPESSCTIGLRTAAGNRRIGLWAETSGLPPPFCDAQTHRVVSGVGVDSSTESEENVRKPLPISDTSDMPKLTHLSRTRRCRPHLLVPGSGSGTPATGHRPRGRAPDRRQTVKGSSLQSLIQLFFTDRLRKQLGVSPHTVAAYRDAFRLLLQFASERLSRAPSELSIADLRRILPGEVP